MLSVPGIVQLYHIIKYSSIYIRHKTKLMCAIKNPESYQPCELSDWEGALGPSQGLQILFLHQALVPQVCSACNIHQVI
jgi:hypothetical protein